MFPAVINSRSLTRLHFYLLVLIFLNWMSGLTLGINLHINIILVIKIIFWFIGIILFFWLIKTKGGKRIYFAIYFVFPLIVFFIWVADKIFGALLGTILLLFFYPPEKEFSAHGYSFYKKTEGPIAPCCGTYQIRKSYFLIFQKTVAEVKFDDQYSFNGFDIKDGKGQLHIKKQVYENNNVRYIDTMLIIPLK